MRDGSIDALLRSRPDIERVEAFVCDINGVARGKWIPRDKALDIVTKGLPLPRSIFALDIWGGDVADAGLAFGTGDPDGLCWPVAGSAAPMAWAAQPTAQVMLTMRDGEGAPFFADPRAMLAGVVDRLAQRGLVPVVATELEFYLFDGAGAPKALRDAAQVLSIDALRDREGLLDAILENCVAQGVPTETMLRENGPGQYEINLRHQADACAAADHAVLLKRIVRATARQHGCTATFMAKPLGDQSGSGMHVHVSLLDRDGRPVLAGEAGGSSAMMDHAVGGLIATMPDAMLLFAPHANSYRRFRSGSHAPVTAGWGVDDRSAAIRVILETPAATRIEQRVSGADCNPYLAVAGVLAGILHGIESAADCPPAQSPLDEGLAGMPLPLEWGAAIDRFAASNAMADALGAPARDVIAACKRQDRDELLGQVLDTEYAAYLGTL